METALRYIHFIGIFIIFAALACEHLLLARRLDRAAVARLARIDAVYGAAAGTLLAADLALWLGGVGKPASFYGQNPVFHAKLGLFALVGLLSIYPTVFLLRRRKGADDVVDVRPASSGRCASNWRCCWSFRCWPA